MKHLAKYSIAFLLVITSTAANSALGQEALPREGTLTYSEAAPDAAEKVLRLKGTDGGTYVFSLIPETDIHGHVVLLRLLLQDTSAYSSGTNLLEPAGNWHGIQPFLFAGWDLEGGMHHSTFGTQRLLPVRKSTMRVCVSISNAQVRTDPHCHDDFRFDLSELSLVISTEQNPSKQSGRVGTCTNPSALKNSNS